MKKFYLCTILVMMLSSLTLISNKIQAQSEIFIQPVSCQMPATTAAAMNAAAVASSGATPFATWTAAYNYATSGGGMGVTNTVTFSAGHYNYGTGNDWGDANGGHELPSGFTVNGGGALIQLPSGMQAFATINGDGVSINNLILKDFSSTIGGSLVVNPDFTGWAITDVTIDNGDILSGPAVFVDLGDIGSGTLSGMTFVNNTSGNALEVTGSDITMNDLDILNTSFSCNGDAGTSVPGGAINITGGAHVDISGSSFFMNTTSVGTGGGAISIVAGSDVTITGSNFRMNTSTNGFGRAGAIWVDGSSSFQSSLSVSASIFEENSSSSADGGAISVNDNSDVVITNSLFLGNSAGDEGGALYIRSSGNSLSCTNCTFTENNSSGSHGIITGDASLTCNRCVLTDNMDTDIDRDGGTFTLTSSRYETTSGTISSPAPANGNIASSTILDADYNNAFNNGFTGTYAQLALTCPAVTSAPADACPLLPVELLYFKGKRENSRENTLEWATATEINNDYFEIERSTDGTTFVSIGKEDGAGNSNSVLLYGFMDTQVPSESNSYYRLKQVDYDGARSYSSIINIARSEEVSGSMSLRNSIASDYIYLDYSLADPSTAVITVYNYLGQQFIQLDHEVDHAGEITIPIDVLPDGSYFIHVQDKNSKNMEVFKFMKN